jgi:PTH1 family peptidyl-tRNA hydrolase
MIIIVGLGNPGIKFKNTRHNVGFLAIEEFAKQNNFGEFKLQKKLNAEITESEINNEKIILTKPQTFMNDSGKFTKKITTHYKLQTTNLIVIHDDIDLPIGKIKIIKDRGSAGHKGVESIIKEIGSSDFIRFRIGIESQKPEIKNTKAKTIVLKNFSKDEKILINETIKKTTEALNYFLQNGLEKTMNKYNS